MNESGSKAPAPPPRLERETIVTVSDRSRVGWLMMFAALGGMGLGFGLATAAYRLGGMCPARTVVVHRAPPEAPVPEPARLWHAYGERPRTLGVTIEDTPAGVEVVRVARGSRADRAGIEPGDAIVAVDGEPIGSARELGREVRRARGNTLLRIERDGDARELVVPLGPE